MPTQIKLVATGYCASVADYLESAQWQLDRPGFIIDRKGVIHGGHGEGNVVALVNTGPVVLEGGRWLPAYLSATGKYRPIEGAEAVRVPYEYCSCKPYHGCMYYEMMGSKQLEALRKLLKSLLSQLAITFPYDNQLGAVCPRAVAGRSGIYFASSYDRHRSDIHPQVELLHLIQSLAS